MSLHDFDILIVDEAQRLQPHQLDKIQCTVNSLQGKCIFSYDPAQTFTNQESFRKIGSIIEQNLATKTYWLTDKIRTNKEIASFIVNLFDLSKTNPIFYARTIFMFPLDERRASLWILH